LVCIPLPLITPLFPYTTLFRSHQPIEHLSALRCIPNLLVLRPADAQETAEAWRTALKHRTGPSALVLTRQKLPLIDRSTHGAARSEEHTSELQSRENLVCRLLL